MHQALKRREKKKRKGENKKEKNETKVEREKKKKRLYETPLPPPRKPLALKDGHVSCRGPSNGRCFRKPKVKQKRRGDRGDWPIKGPD